MPYFMGRREEQQKKIGRVILVVIYLIYVGIYAYALQTSASDTYQRLLGATVLNMLWTTVLFAALCCNQRWARYTFLALIAASVVLSIPLIWELRSRNITLPHSVWVILGFHLLVFATLSYSPFIKALGKK